MLHCRPMFLILWGIFVVIPSEGGIINSWELPTFRLIKEMLGLHLNYGCVLSFRQARWFRGRLLINRLRLLGFEKFLNAIVNYQPYISKFFVSETLEFLLDKFNSILDQGPSWPCSSILVWVMPIILIPGFTVTCMENRFGRGYSSSQRAIFHVHLTHFWIKSFSTFVVQRTCMFNING